MQLRFSHQLTATRKGILLDDKLLHKSTRKQLSSYALRYIERAEELLKKVQPEDWDTHTPHQANNVPELAKAQMMLALANPIILDKYSADQPRDWHGRWANDNTDTSTRQFDHSGEYQVASSDAIMTDATGEWKKAWIGKPHQALREFIANSEQPNVDSLDAYGYDNIHKSTDALGRYQLTPIALQDIDLKDEDGNWNTANSFYTTYHIKSDNDFLQNEAAQETAMTAYLQRLNQETKYAQQYINTSYTGVSGQKITVTMSGILAAAQREGGPSVNNYFHAYGRRNTHGKNLSNTNLAIETRLRLAQYVPY